MRTAHLAVSLLLLVVSACAPSPTPIVVTVQQEVTVMVTSTSPPTATSTSTPEPTATPTATPTPTSTSTPDPRQVELVEGALAIPCPSFTHCGGAGEVVFTLDKGDQVKAVGRTDDSHWIQVKYDGDLGWLPREFLTVSGVLDQMLPVIGLPIPTATLTPSSAATQIAAFVHPVGPEVPMYCAFDLDPAVGTIESNAGQQYNGITFQCDGSYFILGTRDNHFGYDYGTGNCSKHLVGTLVNGMSVGFDGTVLIVGTAQEDYRILVDYGRLECTDGKSRRIVIQYAHSIPLVAAGEKVSSSTAIAELEQISVEIEVQVKESTPLGHKPLDPRLIGLEPRCPSFCG